MHSRHIMEEKLIHGMVEHTFETAVEVTERWGKAEKERSKLGDCDEKQLTW
jgi:hypothetical protein